jgi:hypothetical protein
MENKKEIKTQKTDKKVETKKEPVVKVKRVLVPINKLRDGTGWVSFTNKQMLAIGIDPEKHTSADLRKLVFEALQLTSGRVPEKAE